MEDTGLRRRNVARRMSDPQDWSGRQVHKAKGPALSETTVGVNFLDEPDLRNHTVSQMASNVMGTASFGGGVKTHTVSASMASVGDDTTHLRLGSVESSGVLTPSTGPRLLTAKANASVVDGRYGSKTNFVRMQALGVEANFKVDKPRDQPLSDMLPVPTGIPSPGLTVRAYAAAMEVGGGVSTKGYRIPLMSPDFEFTASGKVRASIGRDLVGKDKSAVRLPVSGVGDLKVKVSGGVNFGRVKQKTE